MSTSPPSDVDRHASEPSLNDNAGIASHENTQSGTTSANGTGFQSTKDSIVNTASSAMTSIQNHPATQQVKNVILNGSVGQSISNQTTKTSNEFQDLAASRKIPNQPAATGQPLTAYHSLLYRLLSWRNPRATSIAYGSIVSLLLISRYVDILGYFFKGTYTILGITALAELAGKIALGNGLATHVRPRKYYTIRKESLERFLDDVEQLINFAVIEAQRVLFVENIWITSAAFTSSFISYWLIKWLPFWGLALIATSVVFLGPLVYLSNQEFIDAKLTHAGNVISNQASQVRQLATQQTNQATESLKTYAGEYSQKAQELVASTREKVSGQTKQATTGTSAQSASTATPAGSDATSASSTSSGKHLSTAETKGRNTSSTPAVKHSDFPSAPHTSPLSNESQSDAPVYAQQRKHYQSSDAAACVLSKQA